MGKKELLKEAKKAQNPISFKIYPFLRLSKTLKCQNFYSSSYYFLAASYNPKTKEIDKNIFNKAESAMEKASELDKRFEEILLLFEDIDFIPMIWKFLFQTDLPHWRITHPYSDSAQYYALVIQNFPNFNKHMAKALGIYSALGEKHIRRAKKLL